jgi:gluconokinase
MSSNPTTSQDQLPDLVFFFGLAGAGKTYCGNLVSSDLGYHCYDLDTDCTPEMRAAIASGTPFTEQMRDDFFAIVTQRIRELKEKYPKLLVMQAAYKERHRAMVVSHHPGLQMVWVDAPDELITHRLQARGDAVSAQYASRIRANFEAPASGLRLLNDVADSREIRARFTGLFGVLGE